MHEAVAPFKHRTWCALPTRENSEAMYRQMDLRKLAPGARAAEIERLEAAAGDDPHAWHKLFQSMLHASWYGIAEGILARMELGSRAIRTR